MKRFLLVVSACLLTVSAFAQEAAVKFDPYVSLRAFFGYHNMSIPTEIESKYADNEMDMAYRLQGNSRFGTNFAAGNVKGVVEFGFQTYASGTTPANSLVFRLGYATYDFGAFQLKVGQDYTPYTWLATSADYADDNNLTGFGASYDGRLPQIMISTNGLYVACIAPSRNIDNKSAYGTTDATLTGFSKDTTVVIPKTAIGYDFKAEGIVFGLGGVYNAVKINDSVKDATAPIDVDGKTVVSYLGYVHGDFSLGILQLRANFAYGQNAGNFGINLTPPSSANNDSITTDSDFVKPAAYAMDVNGSIKNSTHMEGYVNVIAKLAPSFQIGGAVGYQSDKLDVSGSKADKQMIYSVDAKYAVDKNLAFCPTYSYRDYMKGADGIKQGTESYAGVKIQYDIK